MLAVKNYSSENFPIDSGLVFEKVLNLDEPLTGQSVKINSIFNPGDKTPSMILFYSEQGFYRFKDFSTGKYGDVSDIVMYLYKIDSRQDAFVKILEIFDKTDYVPVNLSSAGYVKIVKEISKYKTRRWLKYDELFWKEFYIGGPFLKEYRILPIDSFTITATENTKVTHMDFNPAVAYGYFNKKNELCKIYTPLNKKMKFLKVNNMIQGHEQLKYNTKCLIIGSSLKDIGAFKSMKFKEFELVAPDSENVDIPREIIEEYKSKYTYIFSMFDNDIEGMKAMKHYKKEYGIPYIYFTVEKDVAECVKQHGPESSRVFFKPILRDAIRKENIRLNNKQ